MRLKHSVCVIAAVTWLSVSLIVSGADTDSSSNSNSNKLNDDYVLTTQSECYSSKRIVSCFKYRISRYLWSFATGRMNIFSQENDLSNGIKFIRLNEPSDNGAMFPESRQFSGKYNFISIRFPAPPSQSIHFE